MTTATAELRVPGADLVEVQCKFTSDMNELPRSVVVPKSVVGEDGLARAEVRGREVAGYFVSPEGSFYDRRKTWADYCD